MKFIEQSEPNMTPSFYRNMASICALLCRLPTPVQSESIPLILGGGDVMVAAETGSGKTGAFALPVLQLVHETLTARQQNASANPLDAR
jgi:superfamily II DNA/RNA helicase